MKPAAFPPPPAPAHVRRPVDQAAAQWVMRRRTGLDAAGEAEFAAWQAADPAHVESLQRMTALADAFQRARSSGAGDAIVTELRIRERRRRRRRRIVAGAGLAAVLVWAAGWWGPAARPEPSAVLTNAARSAELMRRLPDGSIVELNVGARIAVRFESDRRLVELTEGEALFRVEKDAARPFVVRAAGVEVRAVGTAFNVKLAGRVVEVLVTEGKVGVDDAAQGHSLLLAPPGEAAAVLVAGQGVTVQPAPAGDAPRPVRVAAVAPAEMKERLAWRIPRLEFDGVELARAVEQLNRVNRVQVSIEGAGLGRLRVSGTFFPDDPRTFARLAAASLGLEAQPRGEGEIVLREAGRTRKP